MSAERITALLDEAAERYNQGQYEEAIGLWNEVLQLSPAEQKAREGIRMARLLMAEQAGAADTPVAAADADVEKVAAGLARVKELMAAGQFEQALEGCTILSELAPDHPEVRALAEEIGRSAGFAPKQTSEGDVETLLAEARAALEEGRNKEASAAASKALQIDPSNMEACGILSLAADDETTAVPLDIDSEESAPRDVATGGPPLEAIPLEDPAGPAQAGPDPVGATTETSRIDQLIEEGQAAFDAGKPQEAVEIWSRVFALDQTNALASQLMDKAKAAIDEQTREIDDLFFRAVDAYDADRLEEALGLFQHLLSVSPFHVEAASYVEQINARLTGEGETIKLNVAAAREADAEKKPDEEDIFDGASVALALDRGPMPQPAAEPDAAPAPASAPRAQSRHVPGPPPRGGFKRLLFATAGAAVFVVAAVGAYLWFGTGTANMPEAEATTQAPAPATPPRPAPPPAQAASTAGPLQVLPGAKPKPPEPAPELPKVEDLKEQAAAMERQGLKEYAEKHWAEAVLALRKAAELDPLDFKASDQLDDAMKKLERQARLEEETILAARYFKEQDYASALHKLYRLQLDYPEIKQFDRYIRNSWYNWGVVLLQSGAVDEAEDKFSEALGITPNDQSSERGREIAQRYHGRTRDAAFDAFATSLSLRDLDQR